MYRWEDVGVDVPMKWIQCVGGGNHGVQEPVAEELNCCLGEPQRRWRLRNGAGGWLVKKSVVD